ncbi:flagellar export protein FliJ [Calidifontibacillus erzurumensis]|uniref:flagellar export protein FliJ n=1 Tax=Calidifontibacillus erzurumensis TaxID=2741433 RepID=UPI0035B5440E
MAFTFKFSKVLALKEKEKDAAKSGYNEAVQKFENAATELYLLLKQKEEFIEEKEQQIQKGIPIAKIQNAERFLLSLEKSINYWQGQVAKTRRSMEIKQQYLLEKNIEVKKYEKLKEKSWNSFSQFEKTEQNKMMDEISIQQYMNRGNQV